MRPLTLAAIAAAIAATVPNPAAAYDRLTGKQIATQLIDRPFIYRGYEDGERKEGRIVYERSGRLTIRTRDGDLDAGTWTIANGLMCTRITIGRGGARTCFSVTREIDGSYVTNHKYRLYPDKDRSN